MRLALKSSLRTPDKRWLRLGVGVPGSAALLRCEHASPVLGFFVQSQYPLQSVLHRRQRGGAALAVLRRPSGEGAALLAVELVGGVGWCGGGGRGDGGLGCCGFVFGLGLGFLGGFGSGDGFGAEFNFTGQASKFFTRGNEGVELIGGGYGQVRAFVGGGKQGVLVSLGEDEGEEVGVEAQADEDGEGDFAVGEVFEDGAAVAKDLPPFGVGHPGFAAGKGADVHGAGPFGW